jgi:hypothetical protein
MRKLILAAVATTALAITGTMASGIAQATAIGPSTGVRTALEDLNIIETAQFSFQGRRHCWYTRGWNGAGWYQCGYQARKGHGWGGAEGWNGWHRR